MEWGNEQRIGRMKKKNQLYDLIMQEMNAIIIQTKICEYVFIVDLLFSFSFFSYPSSYCCRNGVRFFILFSM